MNVCRWHGDFLPAVGGVQAHRPAPELSTTAGRCDRRSSARARNLPAGLAACASRRPGVQASRRPGVQASRRPTKLGPVPVTAAASACWAWPSACRYWDGSLTHARTRDGQFELSLTLPVAASCERGSGRLVRRTFSTSRTHDLHRGSTRQECPMGAEGGHPSQHRGRPSG